MSISVTSLSQQQLRDYNAAARVAIKSQELEGMFGRLTLLRGLITLYQKTGIASQYIGEIQRVLLFVQGNTPTTPELSNQQLIDQVDKYVVIPFFSEKNIYSPEVTSKLQLWIALWARELDSQLRTSMPSYMNLSKTGLKDEVKAQIVLDLNANQVSYLTAIIRRSSALIIDKYPDKAVDMKAVYDSTTQNAADIQLIDRDTIVLISPDVRAKVAKIKDMLDQSSNIMSSMLGGSQASTLRDFHKMVDSGDIVKENLDQIISWLDTLLISNGIERTGTDKPEVKQETKVSKFNINQIQISPELNNKIAQFNRLRSLVIGVPDGVLTHEERVKQQAIISSIKNGMTQDELNVYMQWLKDIISAHPLTQQSIMLAQKYREIRELSLDLYNNPNVQNFDKLSAGATMANAALGTIPPDQVNKTLQELKDIAVKYPQGPAAAPPAPVAPAPPVQQATEIKRESKREPKSLNDKYQEAVDLAYQAMAIQDILTDEEYGLASSLEHHIEVGLIAPNVIDAIIQELKDIILRHLPPATAPPAPMAPNPILPLK